MRHVRHDNGLFQFSEDPFPAFRPQGVAREAARAATLRVLYGIRPDSAGLLPTGDFSVMRSPNSDAAVVPSRMDPNTPPGILLFGHVAGDFAKPPELVEGLRVTVIDRLTDGDAAPARVFCAVMRGDERVVIRTFDPGGPREAHVFKSDGSYAVVPWEEYKEEWKLRRLARLCFD